MPDRAQDESPSQTYLRAKGSAMTVIRLATIPDSNGNPRRVFVWLTDRSRIGGAWTEGCNGHESVPLAHRELAKIAPTFATTVAEFNYLVRLGSIEGS